MFEPDWSGLRINPLTRRAWTIIIGFLAAIGAMAPIMAFEARAGASSRSPDFRDEASLADALGVLDDLQLSMAAGTWKHGSVPSRADIVNDGNVALSSSLLETLGNHDAELHWYSPQAVVREFDLNPSLTDAQGAQNYRQVLALSIPRRPLSAAPSDSLWASLTYPLDVAGLDLFGARFIELWVNDWRDQFRIRGPGVKLHIDLGSVSEDQMRAPDQPPNARLDSEDRSPRDQVLIPAEDTGVDGAGDAIGDGLSAPLDLSTASVEDPAGDDYGRPSDQYEEIDPRRWLRTNGTERNRSVVPFPDTEDLNLNDKLDRLFEGYDEYTIDLSDGATPYLATDVYAEFAGTTVPHPPRSDNGWRLYRIPIDAGGRLRFSTPDPTRVRHIRLWIEGVLSPDGNPEGAPDVMRPLLMLGGMLIAGEFPWLRAAASPVPVMRSWPNPAREGVTIALSLPGPRHVDLTVYDLGGRRVRRLGPGTYDAGVLSFKWDGRDAAGTRVRPGLYLIEARSPGFASSTKVILAE